MGTISKIRQISPYLIAAFAILFITFMVLSDNIVNLAETGGENLQTAAICEINGEKIFYRDYEKRVRERIEQIRNDQQNPSNEVDEQNVRNQIWDEMVREMLLRQAGEQLGIAVTDAEILDILLENPPDFMKSQFTGEDGVFNRQLYLEVITNPDVIMNLLGEIAHEEKVRYIADFRKHLVLVTELLRQQKLSETMTSTISTAFAVSSPNFVGRKFIDDNSTASVNYIFVGLNTITDSIDVTDEEIKNYYDKNKEFYRSKNQRKVKTLTFPIAPSDEDSARAVRRIERIQEELASVHTSEEKDSIFSVKLNEYTGTETDWQLMQDINYQVLSILGNASEGEIFGPVQSYDGIYFYRLDGRRSGENEVVRASHILISFNNNKDSARAYAAKLMREINAGNFAEYAIKHSEDKGSGAQGGDLGYFGRGRMVPEFEKAAFGARVGAIVGPVESQFGYHIIRVVDKKSDEMKYSFISFKPTISMATRNKIKRDAFAAMKQIEEGVNIDTLASRLELHSSESPLLSRDRPFQGSMFLTNRIFEAKLGDVLEPREIANGSNVIVLQVSDVRKAGIAPLEDVKDQIKAKLTRIKRLDLAKLKAEQIYNVVKNHTSLNDIEELPEGVRVESAEVRNNGFIAGVPTDFAATSNIFKLPTNQINSPIRGEHGYFIFEIKSREIPTAEQAKDAEDLTRAQYVRGLFDTWFNKFREDSKILDHRSKYYSEY